MLRTSLFAVLLAVLSVSGALMAQESNKWRVEFSEGAKSDGNIVFEFAPEGESSFEVSIAIEDGTGENAVARKVLDTLKEKLPEDLYSVEVDDGEDVLIKKHHGAKDFGLRLISNTVEAVRINIDKE